MNDLRSRVAALRCVGVAASADAPRRSVLVMRSARSSPAERASPPLAVATFVVADAVLTGASFPVRLSAVSAMRLGAIAPTDVNAVDAPLSAPLAMRVDSLASTRVGATSSVEDSASDRAGADRELEGDQSISKGGTAAKARICSGALLGVSVATASDAGRRSERSSAPSVAAPLESAFAMRAAGAFRSSRSDRSDAN